MSLKCLLLSVAPEIRENWVSPSWSARCFPFSGGTTLSSSMSHLLPTMITWALSHEYVLICVALWTHSNMNWAEFHLVMNRKLSANHVPVLDSIEGLLISDVVHENKAHSATVVGCGDGAVTLLTCCVLQTNAQAVTWPFQLQADLNPSATSNY